jgi:hypothetical protein
MFHAIYDAIAYESATSSKALDFVGDIEFEFDDYVAELTNYILSNIISKISRDKNKSTNIVNNLQKTDIYAIINSRVYLSTSQSFNERYRDLDGRKIFGDLYLDRIEYLRLTLRKPKKEKSIRVPFNLKSSTLQKFKSLIGN